MWALIQHDYPYKKRLGYSQVQTEDGMKPEGGGSYLQAVDKDVRINQLFFKPYLGLPAFRTVRQCCPVCISYFCYCCDKTP